jgi:preprotein translocase subunit SecB
MADENQAGNGAGTPPQPQVRTQVVAQYIRDMSFENVAVQKGLTGTDLQPEIQMSVIPDARKRTVANQYDVISKYKVASRNKVNNETLYLLELEYGATFLIEGIPEDQLHPFLLIECQRLMFPFVRRIILDTIRDGGFPPFNLDPVDFVSLYRQELARRVQAQQAAPAEKAN